MKKIFLDIETIEWGESTEFDMVINATSLGLNKNDEIKLNYIEVQSNKFFYDTIYNPKETNFLKNAKRLENKTENGKMMFIYQAHQSFSIWHKILPVIDDDREHPALISGNKTFLLGLISLAVSAIKCTPHIIIISALVLAASIANASESAEKSEIP